LQFNCQYDYFNEEDCLENLQNSKEIEFDSKLKALKMYKTTHMVKHRTHVCNKNQNNNYLNATGADQYSTSPGNTTNQLAVSTSPQYDVIMQSTSSVDRSKSLNKLKYNSNELLVPTMTSRADNNSKPNSNITNKSFLKYDVLFDSQLDPFNDMELKTINDIEELTKILQSNGSDHAS
jgi:hypothetical protein